MFDVAVRSQRVRPNPVYNYRKKEPAAGGVDGPESTILSLFPYSLERNSRSARGYVL